MGAISLIGDETVGANPFTATGTRAGAGGVWAFFEEQRKICMDPTQQIPLVGATISTSACSIERLAGGIGVVDPEYAKLIRDLLPSYPNKAKDAIKSYMASNRPASVQGAANQLAMVRGNALQVPLIIVQGTNDHDYFPHLAILAWRKIMLSQKTSKARLYFLKGLNHTLAPNAEAAAFNHLQLAKAAVNWAETGVAPGSL